MIFVDLGMDSKKELKRAELAMKKALKEAKKKCQVEPNCSSA